MQNDDDDKAESGRRQSAPALAAMALVLTERPTAGRRGRPKGSTRPTSGIVMIRRLELIALFAAARDRDLTHTEALGAAVSEMKARRPSMKGVNRAEVERALREFQPEKDRDGTRCAMAWSATLTDSGGGAVGVGLRPKRRRR